MLPFTLLVSYNDSFKDEQGNKHYDYPDVWTSFAKDALTSVFLWTALSLAIVLIAIGVFLRYKNREALKRYATIALSVAVGFAATVIIAMLALTFFDMQESGAVFDIVLYPSVVLGAMIILGAAAVYASMFCSPKTRKITEIGRAHV